MKALRNPYLWSTLAILLALVVITGCNTPNRPQGTVTAGYNDQGTASVGVGLDVTTNVNVGLGGQYNVPTGAWSANVVVTFKDAPSAETVALLSRAGASVRSREAGRLEYIIPNFSRKNATHLDAVEAALLAGATLTGNN